MRILPDGSPLAYVMHMDHREDGTAVCVGIGIEQPESDERRPIADRATVTQPVVREFASDAGVESRKPHRQAV